MKAIALAFCAALALSGCALGKGNVQQVLGNLDRDCVRHYQGSAATGTPIASATITFTIDCKPASEVQAGSAAFPTGGTPN